MPMKPSHEYFILAKLSHVKKLFGILPCCMENFFLRCQIEWSKWIELEVELAYYTMT